MNCRSNAGSWRSAIFASLVATILCLLVPSAIAQQITVMQANVEGNNGHGLGRQSNNTNAQTKAMGRIVNYNQPDILLFNEIDASNGLSAAASEAALIDWVTNNVPYLGTQPGVTFFVKSSTTSDGFIRNSAVSRFPIFAEATYTSGNMVRGLHAFRVQLEGTNVLQIFHAHFKCCHATGDCGERQTNAVFASNTIRAWATTNSLPYIFAGDWNEDEGNAQCAPSANYRPITMVRTNGNFAEFIPGDLDGGTKTISTPSPTSRFDYCLAATNRLTAVSGYVFNSGIWAAHGLYTNASPQNLTDDSTTASDHCSIYVDYSFPTSVTNFSVTPTNVFASSGNQAGPFSPSSQVYALTNSDTIPLFWSVTKTSSWLTISTLATNLTLGAGAGTNITATINSSANSLFAGTYVDTINFSNTATGVSFSRDVMLTVNPTPPSASFTGSPTNGFDSVTVTFTDTSTGSITNRFWDFGDTSTTNVTTNSVAHTYAVGTYTVTLIASGPLGVSTNTKPNYITVLTSPSTINIQAANLEDGSANLAPTSTVVVLVADTGADGFVDPQSGFSLNLGAAWGTDDKVVGVWDLVDSVSCTGSNGSLCGQTIVTYTNGIAAGQKLQLYWFPSLTLASNTLGVTSYGKYTDTNSPALDGSDIWQIPAGGSTVTLSFLTTSVGGSNPNAAGQATNLTVGLTAFQSWQIQYFGDMNNPAAGSNADPDGDGQNNMAEFLAGTNPTNSVSSFEIISVVTAGPDVRLTWRTGNGRTNAVQATSGAASYTNSFADVSPAIVIFDSGEPITNFLDVGGASNAPARYYRIRLVQ